MSETKAVRDAKARVAEIEAQRATLNARVEAADAIAKPLREKLARIRAKRQRTPIISNTGGRIWTGSLAAFSAESYGLRSAAQDTGRRGLAKAIADALESGGLKIAPNGGQSLTLRGLAGRVRIPDKAALAAWKRAVAASDRADKRAREAQRAEDAALQAAFDSATKVPTTGWNADGTAAAHAILPDLVAEAVAQVHVNAAIDDDEARAARQQLRELTAWEGSPLNVANAHLKFAQSGSKEPCPCSNCAAERQKAIRDREEAARRAALPTRMVACPDHGRRRMPVENVQRYWYNLPDELQAKLPEEFRGRQVLLPVGYCPKGEARVLLTEFLAAYEKAKAKAAKAAKVKVDPHRRVEGETITFTCPACGEVTSSEVYLDEDGEQLRVGCDRCEAEPLAGAVVVHRERKAA